MYLLAISGGPDSMCMLNEYKNKNIVVAHVNYNKRKDSINDENIVRSFCKKYNIKCEILSSKEKISSNFQSQARKIRYVFFKKVYEKYNCKLLLTAHHKDDFLETAIMQQQSKRTPRFFGIKKRNKLFKMKILRPYLNLHWKNDIIKINKKNNINFAIDSTNANSIFERNKIRKQLQKKSIKEKQNIYSWFKMSNKILKKKFKRVDKKVSKIIKNDHSIKMYKSLGIDSKEALYEIIHKELGNVKLSSNKITLLISFINGKEGNKKFIINDNSFILKKNKKLSYNSINKT